MKIRILPNTVIDRLADRSAGGMSFRLNKHVLLVKCGNFTNLHILRYLPTYWLYLLERYTIDNQRCTHTASASNYIE